MTDSEQLAVVMTILKSIQAEISEHKTEQHLQFEKLTKAVQTVLNEDGKQNTRVSLIERDLVSVDNRLSMIEMANREIWKKVRGNHDTLIASQSSLKMAQYIVGTVITIGIGLLAYFK